jgi:ketosteroid isomerase-like protein
MVPNRWTDLNRQEAIAFYAEGLAEGKPDPENYDITLEEVVVMGDWAYVRQKSLGQIIPANGDPAYLQGSRHFTIVRRQPDGTWKIARDMFNWPPIDEAD